MFWVLLSIVLVVITVVFVDRGLRSKDFEQIPGPRGIPLLENALDLVLDPVKLFYWLRTLSNKYQELFRIKIGPKKFLVIVNPEDVEVLISGMKYNSKGFVYGFIEPWLKDGLLLSNGMKWHHRRKILTPAFHFIILRNFNTVLQENSEKFADKLEMEVNQPRTDMAGYITEFTLHSICETAMGTKLEEHTGIGKKYKDAIFEFGRLVVYRGQRVWMYPNLLYYITPTGIMQNKVVNIMSSFRKNVVDKRRESYKENNDFLEATQNEEEGMSETTGKKKLAMLDLLLQAEKEGNIDSKGIGEEVDTFMFEGHDTTATALQMTFMLLAYHEESQDKILEECRQIFGSDNQAATLGDLSQMKYLEACIKEGLRLYPPVHFITRKTTTPMKLKEHAVPAGTDCTVLIYDLQRRSDQFREPTEFRPERFLTKPTWHPYAYIPFSAGPRNCIGQKFAMMEMKLAISAVVRRYRLRAVTRPQDVVFIMDLILRPNHPIYIKLEKR